MKRSQSIRLVLIGTLSTGVLTGCGPGRSPDIAVENVYTNNFHVPGVGYYHAPFRSWYLLPYNHFDPQGRRYFFGGQWAATPHQSLTNISPPTPEMAAAAQAQRTDISRGGFGSSSGSRWVHS